MIAETNAVWYSDEHILHSSQLATLPVSMTDMTGDLQ